MTIKKEHLDELSTSQRTRLSNMKPSDKERDFHAMQPTIAALTAKKKTTRSVSEASPAEKAKIEKLKEIGQKMKDVNNIFTTGKRMNDDVLMTAARSKLAQLAKIKHELETQVVDEEDDNNNVIHRIGVIVIDRDATAVTKRNEKIQKIIRVKGGSEVEAENRAVAHYKKQGYKVVDAWYIGTGESPDHTSVNYSTAQNISEDSQNRGPSEAVGSDAWYHRARSPNKTVNGVKVKLTDPKEVAAYNQAYEENDEGRRGGKQWDENVEGYFPPKAAPDMRGRKEYDERGREVKKNKRDDSRRSSNFNKPEDMSDTTGLLMGEANEGVDNIEMDVELFIRCLEWAKESAPDDIALHKFTENVVAKNGILTMDDYKSLIPSDSPVEEGIGDIVKGIKRSIKGKESPEDVRRKYFDKSMEYSGNDKQRAKASKNYLRVAKVTSPYAVKEDASTGASSSASIATVVSGTPGLIKRTGNKKKGRYGNSVSPKTFSAVGKGIYEAAKEKGDEK